MESMVIEEVPVGYSPALTQVHQSRISIPPVSGVPRPHLVARVEAGAQGKLTVVSAPAGWGKSTLLAEWANQTSMKVAWVSLEEGDNDPLRFFRVVAAAIDHIYPMQMDDILTMLRSPGNESDTLIDLAILSRLEELPDSTAIILDDFHLLTGPEQLRSLGHVLDVMAPNVHFLLTTRGDVRMPLARLRAAGQLTEIRSEDLAFSEAEARAMLNGRSSQFTGGETLAELVARTEGWAVGLRLASLELGRSTDPARAVSRLRGTHRDIADYFREEILDRMDPALCQFLVEISPLDRFSESLVCAVTGCGNSRELLDKAASADFFLVPLDDERRWYRYHALFRDVLKSDFDRLPWERQAEVHTRASEWYERETMILEAVDQALLANDGERVASLVDTYGDTLMFSCGEANQLVRWIEQIPPDVIRDRPGIVRVYAWALTTVGRIDHAERLLNRAWADLDEAGSTGNRAEWEALLTAVQARVAAYKSDDRATITFGRRALDMLDPIAQAKVYSDVMLSMGFAYRALGDLDTATDTFAEAARLGRLHNNEQAARWGSRYGALTRLAQGRLREAEAIVDEDLDLVLRQASPGGTTLAALLVTKAELLLERGELHSARTYLDQAIPIIQRIGDAKMLMNAYVALAKYLQATGDPGGAREKIRRAEEVFTPLVRGGRIALLDLRQGDTVAALRWARNSGFSVDDEADSSRGEEEQATFARIMALAGNDDGAIGLLRRLIADAVSDGRIGHALELHIVLARALAQRGDSAGATAELCQAIRYARPDGFVQVFRNEGPELQVLLRDLARDREFVDEADRRFVLDLLGRSANPVANVSTPPAQEALPEPLTGRQIEILRLMSDGRSNREIAGALYIAEGTVKAHIHQITGKLMARNRTEAVATARDLHLLG
jgi:LuxR family maltose regulon positive regulatory protein